MKNWFLFIFASFGIVSCATTRSASTSPVVKPAAASTQSSPAFINSISVTPGEAEAVKLPVVKKDVAYKPTKTSAQEPVAPSVESIHYDYASPTGIEKAGDLIFKYAVMLDMPIESISTQPSLFEFIDDWYGTPYRYGGTSKLGIDCSSFSGTLMSNVFGITVPRTSRDQYSNCRRISKNNLQEGDLVFFNIRGRGVSHVGVYLANNKFIHASVNNGVVISDLGEGYYSKKFMGGGRPVK